jgi:nucleoside-diphosphate kinase
MALERTLSIIKPDAVKKNAIGGIFTMIEAAGLKVVATRMVQLSEAEAKAFYAVHAERPFYDALVRFMTSGPAVVSVLEGEDAIATYRKVMGATNPEQAEEGTIRKKFATNIEENAVHGSDAPETAATEVAFFFPTSQIFSR